GFIMRGKHKLFYTLLILIVVFVGFQYFSLLNKVTTSNEKIYSNWINSMEVTHFYFIKAVDEQISEPPDVLKGINIYARAQGELEGILDAALLEQIKTNLHVQQLNEIIDKL